MTKQQAINQLVKMGCTNVVPDGKFCVYLTTPSGQRALVDPRDYLVELIGDKIDDEYLNHGKSEAWFKLRDLQNSI